jgi:hypothetical protein
MDNPLWRPDEEQIEHANMTAFVRRIREESKLKLEDYSDLYQWSIKITEIAVREMIHGRDVENRDALANPESLELFKNIPELNV